MKDLDRKTAKLSKQCKKNKCCKNVKKCMRKKKCKKCCALCKDTCPWITPTALANLLQCGDKYYCDVSIQGWNCCINHQGRDKCPLGYLMCAAKKCVGNRHHCCEHSCDNFGGLRVCNTHPTTTTTAITTATTTTSEIDPCPSGWSILATGCYKFVSARSHGEATSNCEADGGYLAEINDQEEQDEFENFYGKSKLKTYVWLGGTDEKIEGQWMGTYSGREILDFNGWMIGKPSGGFSSNCIITHPSWYFKWHDSSCSWKHSAAALCEYPEAIQAKTTTISPPSTRSTVTTCPPVPTCPTYPPSPVVTGSPTSTTPPIPSCPPVPTCPTCPTCPPTPAVTCPPTSTCPPVTTCPPVPTCPTCSTYPSTTAVTCPPTSTCPPVTTCPPVPTCPTEPSKPTSTVKHSTIMTTTSTMIPSTPKTVTSAHAGCSLDSPIVILSSTEGSIITSPGYPQTNYPDDSFCNWSFQAPPGQKVSFTILDLDTELGYDIIKLYDGASGDEEKEPIYATMSGTKLHEAVISTQEDLRVTFTADVSNNRRGFKASIIAFNKEDLPRFDWLDQNIIEVTFPNDETEIIHLNLSPNADQSCIFQGKTENTSLTISSTNINYGCRSLTQDVEISIISNNLEGKKALFSLKNGKLQKIDETVFISNSLIRGVSQMSKRSTRIKVPKQIHIPVNFGFDRGLLSKLGRYGHGQDFIKRRIEEIFDHGKLLLQGISNSFNIGLIFTGDIVFIDETLNMNRRDLLKIRQFQVDEKIPLIILIEDDHKNNVKGLSYRSGACRNDTERYGVALVAWNDYSTFIGEVVNHEMGHLLGGIHDGETSDHHSGLHLGHSEFNSQNIQEWFTSAGYRCFGKTCSEAPTSPSNGSWTCDNTYYSCQLICTPGFTPVISNIECNNGMWNPTNSHICVPSFSNTVYLLAGGTPTRTNVEIYHPTLGSPTCKNPPPPLPQDRLYHTSFYHSSTIYLCGGGGHYSTCISFTGGYWRYHSLPAPVGRYLSSLVMGEKVVFVGGYSDEYITPTYSTLPLTSSPTLTPVPNLSYKGRWQCVAQLSTTSFVITGGYYHPNYLSTVLQYDFADGSVSSLASLSTPRRMHSCLTIQQEGKLWLIVAGGYNYNNDGTMATTQRLDFQANTWEDLGDLKQARYTHAMINTERGVLVLAGRGDDGDLNTVELLVNKEWQKIEPSLATARRYFGGAVEVPAHLFSCQLNLKPGLGCPALNINSLDKEDETIIEDIATMEDCSLECKKNSNCFFWTWFNQDSGQKRLKCFLMSSYGSTQSDSTAVTADKNCELGCSTFPPFKENGNWTCNEANTTCTLSCSDGFVSVHTRMECSGGEWQDAARINCWRKTQPVSVAGCEDGYLYDSEYPGGKVVDVPEGETCHGLCQKRQGCVTWTWTKDQECRLQTSLGASQNKSGSVSGLKNACRPLCYLVVGDDDAATTNTQYCSDRNQLTSCVDIIQLESSQFKDRDEIVICYEKEDFLCEPINFDDVGLICNPEPGITTLSVYQYINKHRYYGHLKPYFSNWGRPYGGK